MNIYKTSDLALAAYLSLKGLKLVSASRSESGRFEFELEDENKQGELLAVEYVGSEFSQFDNQVRALKKLLYSN
tara:strand:+ start:933 stop:1154 length:222 start_codon:yes stop_codon:yes gene_type:complete